MEQFEYNKSTLNQDVAKRAIFESIQEAKIKKAEKEKGNELAWFDPTLLSIDPEALEP